MSIAIPAVAIQQLKRPIRNAAIGILKPPAMPPRVLVAEIDWVGDYAAGTTNPNVNVFVGMAAGGAQSPIDQIRSVKIDNLGNATPVYVTFLDSTDTIVAPPNTLVWEQVISNSRLANVILIGGSDGAIGRTKVYFCNVLVPPYVNAEINQAVSLWKGSTAIQRTGSLLPAYGAPALGDQTARAELIVDNLSVLPAQATLLPAQAAGFYYITAININIEEFIVKWTAPDGSAQIFGQLSNETGTNVIDIYRCFVLAPTGTQRGYVTNQFATNLSNINLRLDATQRYIFTLESFGSEFTTTAWAALVKCLIGYSHNPT